MTQQGRPRLLFLRSAASVDLIGVVDEVAAGAVRAEAYRVEGAAWLRLVLWVPAETSELIIAVGKLALGTVLAGATLLIGATQFGLVAGGDVRGWSWGSCRRGRSSRGERGVADAEAWRREQHGRGHIRHFVLRAADVALDHAD